ncbi:lipoyl(octanoyl) transferase LipB [Microlunatus soli]|uniref:Octanoyltransferase n=1 Tax=Microlunatus soli TaxID=630515 RepID=A0A1H1R5Y7_9ACTN|nr:lipoyl(octanoyl) transferase LipB [Microlunatus soli]SDS31138.1 lipoyl(octanoyl) transferase [Microlunatus soli]
MIITDREAVTCNARERAAIETVDLGELRYTEAVTMMDHWVARRRSESVGDRLFLLSHPPVITFGRNTRTDELPDDALGIDLVPADRGGYATYHGPGQLVGYLVIDLDGAGPARLIRWLEETVIGALEDLGFCAYRRDTPPGAASLVGVWAGEDHKLVSIGMRIRDGITSHGFAINVDPDLTVFTRFTACRLPGVEMTSLARLAAEHGAPIPTVEAVRAALASRFAAGHPAGPSKNAASADQPSSDEDQER